MVATSVQHPKAPLSGASEPPPETDGVLNDQDVSALLTETHVRPRWFAAVGTSRQSCWPEDSSSARESLRRIDLFRSTFVLAMVHEAAGILRPRNFEDSNRSHAIFFGFVQSGDASEPALADAEQEESIEVTVNGASTSSSAGGASRPATRRGLKVLFLSSDTGGGHRASAESLGKQFQLLFPGSTFELLDVVERDGVPPYNSLVSYYKHLSAHPSQWKLVYSVSNSRAFEMLADAHLKLMCERAVRRSIKSYDPDVVVSVHPLMTNVPVLSCSKISKETGRHLPIFTVVTDLGSAHCLWFANGVDKMFVGSEQVKELAMVRGKVPEDKILLLGLPIRHDFAVQAEKLGDRHSETGAAYQRQVRRDLGLPYDDRKTVLVMGGGEGVGSLGTIVDALYVELVAQGIDALILVVCGRNAKLQESLATRNWAEAYQRWRAAKERSIIWSSSSLLSLSDSCGDPMTTVGCIESGTVTKTVTGQLRRMLSRGSLAVSTAMSAPPPVAPHPVEESAQEEKKAPEGDRLAVAETVLSASHDTADNSLTCAESTLEGKSPGQVQVVGLGFVTRMAEYMVAADVLVSKAGPGTISEAAALSLPIMLTSYLPGQEEGNVDYVIDGGFGAFCSDNDPIGIGEEVCMWLTDECKLRALSRAAKAKGAPHAARDIAQIIGSRTLQCMEHNDKIAAAKEESSKQKE